MTVLPAHTHMLAGHVIVYVMTVLPAHTHMLARTRHRVCYDSVTCPHPHVSRTRHRVCYDRVTCPHPHVSRTRHRVCYDSVTCPHPHVSRTRHRVCYDSVTCPHPHVSRTRHRVCDDSVTCPHPHVLSHTLFAILIWSPSYNALWNMYFCLFKQSISIAFSLNGIKSNLVKAACTKLLVQETAPVGWPRNTWPDFVSSGLRLIGIDPRDAMDHGHIAV